MTVDPERAESVDFSDTYADAKQLIVVNQEDQRLQAQMIWQEKTDWRSARNDRHMYVSNRRMLWMRL